MNEYHNSYVYKSPSLSIVTLFPIKQNWKFSYIRNQQNQSVISQVVGPLGEKFDFFSFPWDLKFEALLITKPQKICSAELSHDI